MITKTGYVLHILFFQFKYKVQNYFNSDHSNTVAEISAEWDNKSLWRVACTYLSPTQSLTESRDCEASITSLLWSKLIGNIFQVKMEHQELENWSKEVRDGLNGSEEVKFIGVFNKRGLHTNTVIHSIIQKCFLWRPNLRTYSSCACMHTQGEQTLRTRVDFSSWATACWRILSLRVTMTTKSRPRFSSLAYV